MTLKTTKTLANGVEMPVLGLGVYKMTDRDETLQAIETAIKAGYRAIDTAALYYNEEEVGEAVRNSATPREELFITTKVWNSDQGYDNTLRAFETSLKKLGLDYVDLYLTHWAVILIVLLQTVIFHRWLTKWNFIRTYLKSHCAIIVQKSKLL